MTNMLIVSDSLAMVSLDANASVGWKDLYATRIQMEMPSNLLVLGAVRANHTGKIVKNDYINEYVSSLAPHVVVLHLGIVDAFPRLFTERERLILHYMDQVHFLKWFVNKYTHYRSRRRYSLTRKKNISYVSPDDFKKNIALFFNICLSFNKQARFILINIAMPSLEAVERNYSLLERVLQYNCTLSEVAAEYNGHVIDLFNITKANPSLFLDDGYHINSEAHAIIAGELVGAISAFFGKGKGL